MRMLLPSISLVLFAGCSAPPDVAINSADFFVIGAGSGWLDGAVAPEPPETRACRQRIESLLCLVDPLPPTREGEPTPARDCVQGVDLSTAARALETLHDAYPEPLREVFCSLGRIYVEREFIGSAYAGTDSQGENAILGIRASLLLESPVKPFREWITWKEQLSFGGDPKSYETRDDLVRVESTLETKGASDLLYFLIAHEFAHIIDFKRKANDFECVEGLCKPRAGTWGEFSWSSTDRVSDPAPDDPWGLRLSTPNESGRFDHRDQLCFYGCLPGHGRPELMRPLYESLERSSFLTTYSATNWGDDFAETVAVWAGVEHAGMRYEIHLPDGTVFDVARKYRESPVFARKRAWIREFMSRAR